MKMNKIAKNFIHTTILLLIAVTTFGASTAAAQEEPILEVDFNPGEESEVLFEELNFLPGDTAVGTVEVTNHSDTAQTVQVEAVNVHDNDELSKKFTISVDDGEKTVVNESSFYDFLRAGEVTLSSLPGGATDLYTFTIEFENTDDNAYQGRSLGFDLCVGFSGDSTQCGDTEFGNENETTDEGGGGGDSGSSGSGGGFVPLEIFNERVTETNIENGTAVIEWSTNRLATSQVIYGPEGTYNLDVDNPPAFGYPEYTTELTPKTKTHTVTLTGLNPGETYVYRVVSRASPPTISKQHTFTLTESTQDFGTGGSGEVLGLSDTDGSVRGISQNNAENSLYSRDVNGTTTETNNATATGTSTPLDDGAFSLFLSQQLGVDTPDPCVGLSLLIIVIVIALAYLLDWFVARSINKRWIIIGGLLIALGILILIGKNCTILPLLVAVLITLIAEVIFSRRTTAV